MYASTNNVAVANVVLTSLQFWSKSIIMLYLGDLPVTHFKGSSALAAPSDRLVNQAVGATHGPDSPQNPDDQVPAEDSGPLLAMLVTEILLVTCTIPTS